MSSKTKTTAMKEEAKPALVPKLRFPEFREAKGWTGEKLGAKTKKVGSGITPTGGDKNYKQSGRPFVRSQNIGWGELLLDDVAFIDEETHNSFSSTQLAVFDVLLNITGASIGRSAVADSRIEGGNVNQHVCIIRVKPDELSPYFLNQYLISHDGQKQIDSFQAGGNRQGLNFEQIRSFLIPLPSVFAEQQKIAECLSSVDELMAAQARKLDALKTHKKGLMQQLFPREGETQPRLRFPEFQNAGEWVVRTIGEMFSLINGCAFKPEDWKPTGTPIIRIQNLNDPSAEFNYSQAPVPERNRVESGDLLFAWSGTLGSSFGARIWNGPSGVLNQHIFKVLMDEQQITLQFALLVLARVEEDIARRTHGFKASFVHVKKSDLVKVELLLPSVSEQQRVASCLSSLDALITAESQKLEALMAHKKGLKQQLFPSPEEYEP
jgi:type I restriction enzyme S subunit